MSAKAFWIHKRFTSRVLSALVTAAALQWVASNALAGLCTTPPAEGWWDSYDANTRSITTLRFRMECRDATATTCNGNICITTHGVDPHYFITLWGSCSPSDCNWGEVEGELIGNDLDGWYYFYYDHGFAKRHVYVQTYPEWPGWLRLWMYTDFVDGREDYVTDEWFY